MSDTVTIALFGLISVFIQTTGIVLLALLKRGQDKGIQMLDENIVQTTKKLNGITTKVDEIHKLLIM